MLIFPAPIWTRSMHNLATTPLTNGIGTSVVVGASNTDGATAALGSALTFEAEYVVIGLSTFNTASANGSTLIDIMIDPAGGTTWSSTPFIANLLAGFNSSIGLGASLPNGMGMKYHFPIRVPSGASLGARGRTAHTSTITGRVALWAFGGNANPDSWWAGQKVRNYAVISGNSTGTVIAPGASGTFSSWVDFGSPATTHAKAIQFGIQGVAGTVAAALAYHFEFSIAGARIGPTYYRGLTTGEAGFTQPDMPIFARIPEGAQLQVRATCSGAAPDSIDVAAYLVS